MPELFDLWLPILLAAVFVFIASSLLHMVIPIHKGDYSKLDNEDAVLEGMRNQGVKPGQFMFPCPSSMKDNVSPEMIEKYGKGPVGIMIIRPNVPLTMGKSLLQWFVLSLAISVVVAYLGTIVLPTGTPGMTVFRFTAAASLLGYGLTNMNDSIWKGVSWIISWKFLFDGLVYALATGAAFAWMWPAAA